MGYWGYRFETLCTVSQPPHKVNKEELKKRDNESANTNVQYCVVVKTKLGNNSIIMGAEVDCCRGIDAFFFILQNILINIGKTSNQKTPLHN